MPYKKNKKAQTIMEYCIIIAIVIGVFVAMSTYFKRGFAGRWKDAIDNLGDQYDPLTANTKITHALHSVTTSTITAETIDGNTITSRSDLTDSSEIKTGYSRMGAYQ